MVNIKELYNITLITQKRNSIGSTSSEIVQLMGTRYAVMQEPSKGDHINEGIMKEITGGDPIHVGRCLRIRMTFVPQFKLVVCTNTMFEIKSNDDGTWRIRGVISNLNLQKIRLQAILMSRISIKLIKVLSVNLMTGNMYLWRCL